MTTVNLKHKSIGSTDWSQDSDQTVQVNNNWQAIWHEYCAFIANSVLTFSQSTTHREIINEVKSLCTNHITDKAAWLLVASKARLAASEASDLDLDEESRAAVLTVLAIAHLALSSDKKWLESKLHEYPCHCRRLECICFWLFKSNSSQNCQPKSYSRTDINGKRTLNSSTAYGKGGLNGFELSGIFDAYSLVGFQRVHLSNRHLKGLALPIVVSHG
ncbi:MAG: hypothetical protein IPL73_16270 [Candidatus Obscuribacter sp.]|nr:hypothetical protein [Candidatus Obscuribacter sp.]